MTNEQRLLKATVRLEAAGEAMTAALAQMGRDADILGQASKEMDRATHEFRISFQRVAERGAG